MSNILRLTTNFSAVAVNDVISTTVANQTAISAQLTASTNYGVDQLVTGSGAWAYLDTGSVVSPFNYAMLRSAETGSATINIGVLTGGISHSFATLAGGDFIVLKSTGSNDARYLVSADTKGTGSTATLQVCIAAV